MYLKEIVIKNFRVFDEYGIHAVFNKGVNAIIGENNSGKSALIDAIRIAFSTVTYSRDIFFTKSDFHMSKSGKKANWAQIDVYLDEVPVELIEIYDLEEESRGEFHLRFFMDTTPSGTEKVRYRAWGGKVEGNPISSETFDAMNIAFLGALRDAESEMRPSRSSKLARLLSSVTTSEEEKELLVNELIKANKAILEMSPIQKMRNIINKNLSDMEQEILHQQIDIGIVDPKFESIASSLRSWIIPRWHFVPKEFNNYEEISMLCSTISNKTLYQLTDEGIYIDINRFIDSIENANDELIASLNTLKNYSFELYQNGLGYNNILFMSAVLGDMSVEKSGVHLNLFTIEEPEAHLHPQLQELIHNFFENKHHGQTTIQVIYTSHSPTLVSRIGINSITLLYEDMFVIKCYPLATANLNNDDREYLEKYLDVTKSQMFFAKGLAFVEGISEAILLPEMAKLIDRPFDKYAVQVINVNGTAFRPFANLLRSPNSEKCFAKTVVITDDDRCTKKNELDTYIDKDLDYDEKNVYDLARKIKNGTPSDRFENIKTLCSESNISLCSAKKTLEYELALHENNIPHILNAIIKEFPIIGPKLKEMVECETNAEQKAIRIWLFVRAREKYKGQIAQALSQRINDEIIRRRYGEDITNPFVVPDYLADAIYAVTEEK